MPSRLRKFFGKFRFKIKVVTIGEITTQLNGFKHLHKTIFITKGGA